MAFYSPMRYPGGKTSLVDYLARVIGANQPIDTYIEPFAGGAGAALGLLINGCVKRIVLNDRDELIHEFWRAVLDNPESLIRKVRQTPISVAYWSSMRDSAFGIHGRNSLNPIEMGFAALYLNRCNRSGIVRADVGPIGGLKQSGRWKISARFNKETIIARIRAIASYRSRIKVSNLDAIDFLSKYARNPNVDRKRTLVYLDPPYYKHGPSLYSTYYSDEDHASLHDFLTKKFHIKWLLSYDDVPFVRALYKDVKKNGHEVNHHVHRAKLGKELLIASKNCSLPRVMAARGSSIHER